MDDVIRTAKRHIENNDLYSLQDLYNELPTIDIYIDIPFVFQKVYLHACLRGATTIINWLKDSIYPTIDQIAQIALRQVFAYGRHLLQKHKAKRR